MDNWNLLETEIWTIARTEEGTAVLLKPAGIELTVPVFIGESEAQSILIGLGDVPVSRPLTHDLILEIIRKTGYSVDHIEIYDLKENTFLGRLALVRPGGSGFVFIDARPSDLIAVAVRCKCPSLVASHVVQEAGIPIQTVLEAINTAVKAAEKSSHEQNALRQHSRRSSLLSELEAALAVENYERAAEIRDILNLLGT
ncbi:hypothetical protein FACS1894151_07830 [Spirochaetia bacterium]|nr:hypothetical protein FACS1894151_07830 [Spirochaetia bacterium]